jgi:ankyrin repeat protein
LSRAAENGNKAVVELLLKNGAQPDLEDEEGYTPLLRASDEGNTDIVQLLNRACDL